MEILIVHWEMMEYLLLETDVHLLVMKDLSGVVAEEECVKFEMVELYGVAVELLVLEVQYYLTFVYAFHLHCD